MVTPLKRVLVCRRGVDFNALVTYCVEILNLSHADAQSVYNAVVHHTLNTPKSAFEFTELDLSLIGSGLHTVHYNPDKRRLLVKYMHLASLELSEMAQQLGLSPPASTTSQSIYLYKGILDLHHYLLLEL